MTLGDTIQLALRNLRQAKLRTALTTMGVSIGIASLAGMVSLGVGLQEQTIGRFMSSGMFDTVTVMSSVDRPGPFARAAGVRGRGGPFGGRGGGRGAAGQASGAPDKPAPKLDDDALKAIAALPRVKEVYPNIRVPVELRFEQFADFSAVSGVSMSARGEGAFQTMAAGAFFANDTDDACVLSLDLAKRISERPPNELIGQQVSVAYTASMTAAGPGAAGGAPFQLQPVAVKFTIVGIVERDPSPLGNLLGGLSGLMIPLAKAKDISARQVTSAQALLRAPAGAGNYASVTVKVTHAQFAQDVEDEIKKMGYQAFSLNDALKAAKGAFLILDILLSLIGSIALAVSSLGVVNTMVMSILERTREIGIMKAIGGSDGDIRRIFLIEASTIGFMGGLLGIAIGWTIGRIINAGVNVYLRSQGGTAVDLFSVPIWLIAMAIGFSVLVSLIAGSYPAGRAARLDPIQALRHD